MRASPQARPVPPDPRAPSSIVRESIADAVDREDEAWLTGVRLELAAQVLDVRVDRTFIALERDAVQRVEQLAPREDAPRLAREGREERELGRGQVDAAAAALGPHPRNVELQLPDPDHVGRVCRAVGPTEHGLHPRHELARGEGLRQIVVSSELEAEQLVELVVPRRDHHDRDRAVAPQFAGHVQAIEPGQAEVENDQVGSIVPGDVECPTTVVRGDDAKPGMLEIVACQFHDPWLVVDDEDGATHDCVLTGGILTTWMRPPGWSERALVSLSRASGARILWGCGRRRWCLAWRLAMHL